MAATLVTEPPARTGRGGRPRDPSRDDVIRAAILRLLADVGYGALTMDAVAAEAGVGKATIYRRWRTKQDLVVDTVSELNRSWTIEADSEGPLAVWRRAFAEMWTRAEARGEVGPDMHQSLAAEAATALLVQRW